MNEIQRLIKVLDVSREEIVKHLDIFIKMSDNASELITLIETWYMEDIK